MLIKSIFVNYKKKKNTDPKLLNSNVYICDPGPQNQS